MKKTIISVAFGVLALAALTAVVSPDIDQAPRWMQNGFWTMPKTQAAQLTSANKTTRMLAGTLTAFDFASVTITCEDSTAVTVAGAQTGDPCFVGPPTTISGAGTGLHSNFTCYVSSADNVKVRHCAAGTADNPASADYRFRVISSQ